MRNQGCKITVSDKGYKALVKRVFEGKPAVITVGVHAQEGGEQHEGAKITVLDVANYMEFGTATIPARSFVRAWFDENQARAQQMLAALMRSVVKGTRSREQILELLGQKFVAEIQARISKGIPPPLLPATIRRKGSSTPLIDTGQLRSSVTYRVKNG